MRVCVCSAADLSWEELGMNVELQGVMQDASVMRIRDNVHQKNRSLRCAAVSHSCSVNPQKIGISIKTSFLNAMIRLCVFNP